MMYNRNKIIGVLLLALLPLVAYLFSKPKFKIGDCIVDKKIEEWELPEQVLKIKKIGKYKYLVESTTPGYLGQTYVIDAEIEETNNRYEKINCERFL